MRKYGDKIRVVRSEKKDERLERIEREENAGTMKRYILHTELCLEISPNIKRSA
jgi:hypothetical protein